MSKPNMQCKHCSLSFTARDFEDLVCLECAKRRVAPEPEEPTCSVCESVLEKTDLTCTGCNDYTKGDDMQNPCVECGDDERHVPARLHERVHKQLTGDDIKVTTGAPVCGFCLDQKCLNCCLNERYRG